MMDWSIFAYFGIPAAVLWIAGGLLAYRKKHFTAAATVSIAGSVIFLVYITGLWMSLGRPPMRTAGETRLWYSFFLSVTGIFIFLIHRYRWILSFSNLLATVFVCINIFKPQIHTQNLMPALQSPWFVPHVIVYMLAYAMMGAATIFACYLWLRSRKNNASDSKEFSTCNSLVRIGFAFITLGIVMGALWAKAAWGDYWAWDPKETWAAAAWVAYLIYLHINQHVKEKQICYALLIFGFILLQMCWWGINYLPSAQGMSIHTY